MQDLTPYLYCQDNKWKVCFYHYSPQQDSSVFVHKDLKEEILTEEEAKTRYPELYAKVKENLEKQKQEASQKEQAKIGLEEKLPNEVRTEIQPAAENNLEKAVIENK